MMLNGLNSSISQLRLWCRKRCAHKRILFTFIDRQLCVSTNMIIRALVLTALLIAVSCDSEVNNRQQKILQRRPQASDSIRAGPPTPPGPIFRSPPTAPSKHSFSARPKSPPPKGGIHPQVEYGFTPISGPNGHAIGGDSIKQQAQESAPVESKKPLIINVGAPKQQPQQQNNPPVSFSYQNSNQGVVEGTFKEKPSFVIQHQKPEKQSATVQQSQKASESQLSFGPFSFNQPVGAKINFESSEKPSFEQSPFPSIQSSFISAGPPKVDKFPPKPASGPNFPPKEQNQNFNKFPKQPPSPPPSFSKVPPKHELPPFSQKPTKEQFGNFPPPPQFFNNGKREPVVRHQYESNKLVHSHPPPPPPPVFRGPNKKIVQQPKPSNNFEIQKASVVGPFSGPPLRQQRIPPPPPPRPAAQPPQEAPPSSNFEDHSFLRNPEFENFPPADFGKGKPIHQEAQKPHHSVLPSPSPQFVQETNPQMFGQSFSSFQSQHPQQQQHQPQPQHHHQQPHFQQPPPQFHQQPPQLHQQQPQFHQPQPQFQQPQPQFHQPQHQLQQPHFGSHGQLPPQFTAQPQFQLQGAQPQYQHPSTFATHDVSKLTTLNPFLSTFPSASSSAGIPQFGSLPQLQSQRINPASAFGGLSGAGVVSQLGLPSAYPQFNPNLAAAAQLYKGILPVQQYPTTSAASSYPYSSLGVNPFLSKTTLQSILPLRSSIPTAVATHSVPGSSVGGVPQFQPLPNSLNFPDDDDEQDIAASQSLKKFIVAPKTNSSKPKKTTLKDILAEDCTGAEDFGYCASPPRYPTQQIKTVLKQCKTELEGLFEQEEEEHHVAKRDTTAEQFAWTTESCSSTTATVEPGYARDSKGHWLVVVQQASSKVHQRVDVDVCGSEGGDCGCKQYYETKNLVAWDPDRPNDCPTVHAFKFPSKCDCPTQ